MKTVVDTRAAAVRQPRGTVKWGGVYGHSWFMDPRNKRIVLLLTNTLYEGMSGKLRNDIVHAIYP